jgi:hypothetical protein
MDGAILFFGITRGQASICAPQFQEIILKSLRGINYDTYLHALELNEINNPRSKELNIKIKDPKDWKLFNAKKYKTDNQEDFDNSVDYASLLKNKRVPHSYTIESAKNIIRQCYSLREVYKLTKEKQYDFYLLSRLDLLYVNNNGIKEAIIDVCSKKNQGILYTPSWDRFGGLNDRLAVGDQKAAQAYCNRFESFNELAPDIIHSETILLNQCLKNNLNLKFLNALAKRQRAYGQVWERDAPL